MHSFSQKTKKISVNAPKNKKKMKSNMLEKCCYILLNVPKVKNKNAMKRTTKLNKCHKNTKKKMPKHIQLFVLVYLFFF